MPFAIELGLDPVSAAIVQETRQQLTADALRLVLEPHRAGPHVTLATCARLDVAACRQELAELAASSPPPAVHFASLGVFPADRSVVFLAPVVTDDLLLLHRRFHERFRAYAEDSGTLYLPGQWVPHCTLAERIERAAVPQVIAICQRLPLPLSARLDTIGILEFPSLRRHATLPFTG